MAGEKIVTERVRCSVCKSACEVLKTNVVYRGTSGYTLYRCSEIECKAHLLTKGFVTIKIDDRALITLVRENILVEDESHHTQLTEQLYASRRRLNRAIEEMQRVRAEIQTIEERLTVSHDQFWEEILFP
ncbi:MAG: hypothetical protein NT135_01430 [Candidatus Berkelbacteria bacterium]|nr:hypothetical protein [Candidatus Berkelbacteria bacterium]